MYTLANIKPAVVTDGLFSGATSAILAKTIFDINPLSGMVYGAASILIAKVASMALNSLAEKFKWPDTAKGSALFFKTAAVFTFSIVIAMEITAKITTVAIPLILAIPLFNLTFSLTIGLEKISGYGTAADLLSLIPNSFHC